MVIKLRAKTCFIFIAVSLLITIAGIFLFHFFSVLEKGEFMGGILVSFPAEVECAIETSLLESEQLDETYHRPSKKTVLANPFSGIQYDELGGRHFSTSEEVCYGYFGILREASNMFPNYGGGCGSIGDGTLPYPYAYNLLSKSAQEKQSLEVFVSSFKGVGHITLLQLIPMTDDRIFVEIESVTGNTTDPTLSLFTYHYAIISTVPEEDGWKIGGIEYFSEPFLCAPYHLWFYQADSFVKIVYIENMNLFPSIQRTEQNGSILSIFSSKNDTNYRLDFVTLTNGYQLLFQENIQQDNSWVPTDLLDENWRNYKLGN